MPSLQRSGLAGCTNGLQSRKPWAAPTVTRIVAGAAEAVTRDGQPDGGNPGTSRS